MRRWHVQAAVAIPLFFALSSPALAQSGPSPAAAAPAAPSTPQTPGANQGLLKAYTPAPLPPAELQNSPRLAELIKDGTLYLSLADALALAVENNLDIAVQRYLYPVAQVDVLRASAGQAARGVTGALVPSGLSAGALGVGVNQSAGPGGVGSAGGISGGGGAVSVPQVGTFDPAVTISSSYDRTLSPLNSVVVAGVPQVTTTSAATSVNYTQLFHDGASVTAAVNGIAQNSTQQSLVFNPAVISRMTVGVNQPLLNGFGALPNKRFLIVAQNDMNTSSELFREQVTTTIVQVENAYWDFVAAQQGIAAAERARDAAQRLVADTQVRMELGTAAMIDLASAQSAEAGSERDLVVAQTNFQVQEEQLKSIISKQEDGPLVSAIVVPTDALPDPTLRPVPDLQSALASAMDKRPELDVANENLKNQDISVRYTRNGLLPTLNAFGLYAGAGLTGDTLAATNGLATSLSQVFGATYPEYAAGVSATVPLRNRSAQADNVRARLERAQLDVEAQRERQRIDLEVRQAVIGLIQGRAQVEAAHEALNLAQLTADKEREKLTLGVSNAYDVVLREHDLLAARVADVVAAATYAKALVEFDRATGQTLEQNGIALGDALAGEVRTPPTPLSTPPAPR